MKRVEFTPSDREQFEYQMEWWAHVRKKWVEAGFDMSKSVVQEFDNATNNLVFTQED